MVRILGKLSYLTVYSSHFFMWIHLTITAVFLPIVLKINQVMQFLNNVFIILFIIILLNLNLSYHSSVQANQSIIFNTNPFSNQIEQLNVINVSIFSLGTHYSSSNLNSIWYNYKKKIIVFFYSFEHIKKEKPDIKVLNSLVDEIVSQYLSRCHVNIIYDDLFDSDFYYKVSNTNFYPKNS